MPSPEPLTRVALTRGTAAGLAGTTAMSATLWLEQRLRGGTQGPVDYDASEHVTQAASRVLHWAPTDGRQQQALFLAVHWGYGSVVGVGRELTGALEHTPVLADLSFYAAVQLMAFTLFPLLGGTPPPLRWTRSVLLSSLAQHAVYAAAAGAVARRVQP